MIVLFCALGFASPISLPVQGVLTDGAGARATGTVTVTFTLYGQGPSSFGSVWSATVPVAVVDGAFSAILEGGSPALDSTLFRDVDDLHLSVQPTGDAESALVPLGHAPLAAWAAHAGDADALGGLPPNGYVRGDAEVGASAGRVPLNNGALNATLNADLLDGFSTGAAAGNIPLNNGSLMATLNADLLDGFSTGAAAGNIPLNNGSLMATLNADLLDGFTTGNAAGNIPLNNSTVNTNLNADLLDGLSSAAFLRADQASSLSGNLTVTGNLSVTGVSFPRRVRVAGPLWTNAALVVRNTGNASFTNAAAGALDVTVTAVPGAAGWTEAFTIPILPAGVVSASQALQVSVGVAWTALATADTDPAVLLVDGNGNRAGGYFSDVGNGNMMFVHFSSPPSFSATEPVSFGASGYITDIDLRFYLAPTGAHVLMTPRQGSTGLAGNASLGRQHPGYVFRPDTGLSIKVFGNDNTEQYRFWSVDAEIFPM
jgi:hypothetical protein